MISPCCSPLLGHNIVYKNKPKLVSRWLWSTVASCPPRFAPILWVYGETLTSPLEVIFELATFSK